MPAVQHFDLPRIGLQPQIRHHFRRRRPRPLLRNSVLAHFHSSLLLLSSLRFSVSSAVIFFLTNHPTESAAEIPCAAAQATVPNPPAWLRQEPSPAVLVPSTANN